MNKITKAYKIVKNNVFFDTIKDYGYYREKGIIQLSTSEQLENILNKKYKDDPVDLLLLCVSLKKNCLNENIDGLEWSFYHKESKMCPHINGNIYMFNILWYNDLKYVGNKFIMPSIYYETLMDY